MDRMTIFAMSLLAALATTASAASAQERVGDAALGALSGAVVLGPVGAVAGAVVGYARGPAIAQSWGLRRSAPAPTRHARTAAPKAAPAAPPAKPNAAPSSSVMAPVKSAAGTPPVQTLE